MYIYTALFDMYPLFTINETQWELSRPMVLLCVGSTFPSMHVLIIKHIKHDIHCSSIYPRLQTIYDIWTYMHKSLHTCIPVYNLHMYLRTYVATVHTYIPTYLRTYVPTYLRTYVPTNLRTYVPTYLRTYVPTYVRTYVPTYSTYLHTYSTLHCIALQRTAPHTSCT